MAQPPSSPPTRLSPPGRMRHSPRMTRQPWSRLFLSAPGFGVSSVLLAWLLLLALLARPRPELLGLWVAAPVPIAPFVRHQGNDLRAIAGRTDPETAVALDAAVQNRL